MMTLKRSLSALVFLALVWSPAHPARAASDEIVWSGWTADLFDRAKAENRFVILDLEAVWCHWCHVMEETTYSDSKVIGLLKSKYLTVRADQDANPDLSSRYGDWGWPATIIFAPDGTELVKRRGYIEPAAMASLLQAVIDDPTPGPSINEANIVTPAPSPFLSGKSRSDLKQRLDDVYDTANGGWGDVHKYIDPDAMDWTLSLAEEGDQSAVKMARTTLDRAMALIDREGGGIFQYSDTKDWSSPHYEKIMWYQANGVRQYAAAYVLWKDPAYLTAAQDIGRFLTTSLLSSDGAFFTSQDADVDRSLLGKEFYKLSLDARKNLGRSPRIDTNIYARENGWAISALAALYGATGDRRLLDRAVRAADWIVQNRRRADGGFNHGDTNRGGPFLGDSVAMGQAAIDLYEATGDRRWIEIARNAGDAIAAFKDDSGGFLTSKIAEGRSGVLSTPHKNLDEQIQVARFANMLFRYSGDARARALSEDAIKYASSPDIIGTGRAYAGVLIADREITREPTHVTIVGHKDDATAAALHLEALKFPASYKRVDWWDKREGALPNADVTYPELETAAAFACSNRLCSLPVFDSADLKTTVTEMLRRSRTTATQ